MKIVTRSLIAIAALAGVFMVAQSAGAGTMSGQCNTCHTMHNSQNGAAMGLQTAQNQLLLNTCFGCHSGNRGQLLSAQDAPIVWHTDGEPKSEPSLIKLSS